MTDPLPTPSPKLGVYRHFKTKQLYRVIGTALHSETSEVLVIYEPLYGSQTTLWARPYSMFIQTIVVNGQEVPRFEIVET